MRTFKLALGAIVAFAITGTTVQAADLGGSLKDEAPLAQGRFSWSGVYGGVHAGYGWGDSKVRENLPTFGDFLPPSVSSSYDADGGIGGVHIGLNRQSGNIVYGAEIRLSGADISGGTNDCFGLSTLAQGYATASCSSKVNWAASAIGRLGYARDRVLVYGLAGWTVAGVDHKFSVAVDPRLFPLSLGSGVNETADGFTFGGGIEYATPHRIIIGLEYAHTNLKADGDGLVLGGALTTGSRNIDLDELKARVSFKLGN